MRIEWQGHYLDGKTASRQRATIHLTQTGLQVTAENGQTIWWPYGEIRQAQGFHSGEQARLEKGSENPEALVIPDAGFLTDLHRVAPGMAARFHNPSRRKIRVPLTISRLWPPSPSRLLFISGGFLPWLRLSHPMSLSRGKNVLGKRSWKA